MSLGASKSDYRLSEVEEWLFQESVGAEVVHASSSDDIFVVEAALHLVAKTKFKGDITNISAKRLSLLTSTVKGMGVDDQTAATFVKIISSLGVESTEDFSHLCEGDFSDIAVVKVRRVLPLLHSFGIKAVAFSEEAYKRFRDRNPLKSVTADVETPPVSPERMRERGR